MSYSLLNVLFHIKLTLLIVFTDFQYYYKSTSLDDGGVSNFSERSASTQPAFFTPNVYYKANTPSYGVEEQLLKEFVKKQMYVSRSIVLFFNIKVLWCLQG